MINKTDTVQTLLTRVWIFFKNKKHALRLALIFISSLLTLYLLHANTGLDLSDEGYFWYGSQRVADGEIPTVDFASYEPGRYYWAAIGYKILGSSDNFAARITSIIFGSFCIGATGSAALRSVQSHKKYKPSILGAILGCILIALTTSVWITRYYRAFDYGAACLTALACLLLISGTRTRDYAWAGVAIGITFFLGRNHALYSTVACSLSLAFKIAKERSERSSSTGQILVFMALSAGTIAACYGFVEVCSGGIYIKKAAELWVDQLRYSRTNVPIDWPSFDFENIIGSRSLSSIEGAVGDFATFWAVFLGGAIATPVFLIAAFRGKFLHSNVTASLCVTTGYLHYMLSRADFAHISTVVIGPAILLVPLVLRGRHIARLVTITGILAFIVRVPLRNQTLYHCYRRTIPCDTISLGRDHRVTSDKQTIESVSSVMPLVRDSSFAVLPTYSLIYALAGRVSPFWDVYGIIRRPARLLQADARRLSQIKPSLVLLQRESIQGDHDFRMSNTHLLKEIREQYIFSKTIDSGKIDMFIRKD